MPLDPEHIQNLLGTNLIDLQERLIAEMLEADKLIQQKERELKDARILKQRRLLIAYENGVPQTVLADVLDVQRQHISKQINEYRLRLGIPDDITLADHEERMAFVRSTRPPQADDTH